MRHPDRKQGPGVARKGTHACAIACMFDCVAVSARTLTHRAREGGQPARHRQACACMQGLLESRYLTTVSSLPRQVATPTYIHIRISTPTGPPQGTCTRSACTVTGPELLLTVAPHGSSTAGTVRGAHVWLATQHTNSPHARLVRCSGRSSSPTSRRPEQRARQPRIMHWRPRETHAYQDCIPAQETCSPQPLRNG